MGPGTFEAKFIPLSKLDYIEKIYVLRDKIGPAIEKVEYIKLPGYINRFIPLKILIPFMLARYARRYRCNLIIGYHIIPHAFFTFFGSMLSGIPYACAQTGLHIQSQSKKKVFKLLLKYVFTKALFINVPGNSSKAFWIDFGIDPNKINTLHSTIDTNRFYNKKLPKEYDFIILSRLSREKRIENLLKIFSEMKKENHVFSVCIVGDGPRRNFLQDLTRELGIHSFIHFVGFVDNPEVWFNKSRIFLLSSKTEGFPTALMQAMACELTVVSTNVGNISDTISNNINGHLVEYSDWNKYQQILIDVLYNNDGEMQIMARNSIIANHSFDHAVAKWDQVFNKFSLMRRS